jgi:hypothetical protein
MFCGRCCVTEPRSRLALQLDIFIEILPRTPVKRAFSDAAAFGRCHHANHECWLINQKRRRKESSSYVLRRKQGDRA